MSEAPAKEEKPAAAAAAAAAEDQKAEDKASAAAADGAAKEDGDKADAKEAKGKKKGKKAAAAAADGDKPKKKTLAQKRAEAEELNEDPAKNLGAAPPVLKEKRRPDNAKPKPPPATYVPQDWKTKSKDVSIPKGKGTKVADCENVLKAVNKLKGVDAGLKTLHSLMFGVAGASTKRKANIREFNGFDADTVDEVKAKRLVSLSSKKVDVLKHLAGILDLETSGAKNELAERIVDFLAKPKASGKEYKFSVAGAKRKRSKSTKSKSKSKDKKEKTKRAPSAYILFTNAKREEVKKKYPEKKMIELSKVLGEMWNDLSDSKKEEWKAKAKNAKPGDGKAKSKSKDKTKKKSKKEESDSGSESESEEESGSESDSGAKDMSDDEDAKPKKKKAEKKGKKDKKDKKEKAKKETKKKSKAKESDDESEEPKKKKAKTDKKEKAEVSDDKIKAATKKAVSNGDEKMSVKTVIDGLKEQFGEDVIAARKVTIKEWITTFFNEKVAKENK